jgi:DNA (cytosine-5)-methyltransferase 1
MERDQILDERWILEAADDLGSHVKDMANALSRAAELLQKLEAAADPQFVAALLKTRGHVSENELQAFRGLNQILEIHPELVRKDAPLLGAVTALADASNQVHADALRLLQGGQRVDRAVVDRLESFDDWSSRTETERVEDGRSACLESLVAKAAPHAIRKIESKVDALLSEIDRFIFDFIPWDPTDGHDAFTDRDGYDAAHARVVHLARAALREFERYLGPVESLGSAAQGSHEEAIKNAANAINRFASGRFGHAGGFSFDADRPSMFSTELADALFYMATNIPPKQTNPAELAVRPPKMLSALELCAGGGGQAIGLMSSGFSHRALYEKSGTRVQTLKRNWWHWNAKKADVRNIPDAEFQRYRKIDLLAAGPPCEPFSRAGARLGRRSDKDLFPQMIRAVAQVRPRAFMFENVPGMQDDAHAAYLASICADLAVLGYRVEIVRLNAEDFGLPQNRERIVIVGLRNDVKGVFVPPAVDPSMKRYVAEVLGPLVIRHETPDALKDSITPGSAQWRYDRWAESWRDEHSKSLLATITKTSSEDREPRLERFRKEGFDVSTFSTGAPSVADACHNGFKPKLTLEILARAQGFPDKWVFHAKGGGNTDMVGDAFPPIMAKAVGLAIYSALTGVRFDFQAALDAPMIDEKMIGLKPLRESVRRIWPTREAIEKARRYRLGEPIETVEPNRKRRKVIRELAEQLKVDERRQEDEEDAWERHLFPDGVP